MKMPARDELGHWWHVATRFRPWQHEFWLGLFHDTVEDGYPPWALAHVWRALWYISRPDAGEFTYEMYIRRMRHAPKATLRVKIADLDHNLTRNGGPKNERHRERYERARQMIAEWLDAKETRHGR